MRRSRSHIRSSICSRLRALKAVWLRPEFRVVRKPAFLLSLCVLLFAIPLVVIFTARPGSVEAAWFDSNWGFRQWMPITNTSGSNKTDYQVQFTLDTSTLITAGKLQNSCADLRFTSITGKNLPYWIEPTTCNTTTTLVWVKSDLIPTTNGGVYLYYGNPTANPPATTPSNVFIQDMPGAAMTWPLDDTVTTQNYSRVVNPSVAEGRNLLINGDMETGNPPTNWAVVSGAPAILSQVSASPRSGNAMRVAYNGATGGAAGQSVLVAGKTYRIKGYARSGGGTTAVLGQNHGQTIINITSSTSWVAFDTTFVALNSGNIRLIDSNSGSGYVEFDDVVLTQVNIAASSTTPTQLLTDGDMETSGVGAWTAFNSTLTKQSTTPHGGAQVLRVAWASGSNGNAYQTRLTLGQVYRVTGYARSDGTRTPQLYSGAAKWTGTTSTNWQPFDVTFIATNTDINLITVSTAAGYTEWDDVVVSPDTYTRGGELLQNAGLETWTDSTHLTNWSGSAPLGGINSINQESSVIHGGTYAARMDTAASPNNMYQISQNGVTVPGKTYVLTFWAKVASGSGGAQVLNNSTGSSYLDFTPTSTYTKYSVRFVALDGGITFRSGAISNSLYLDDLNLIEISPLSGLPTNGVTLGASSGAGGHLTNAYSFDGVNDFVNIYSPDLNSVFNPNEGTLVAWAKVANAGVWTDGNIHSIVQFGGGSSGGSVNIYKISNNQLHVSYESNGTSKYISPILSSTNWFQVVLTWSRSSDQIKAYVNGAQVGSTLNGMPTWNINLGTMTIGATNTTPAFPWSGLINDVRLYTRALSATEIASLYSGSSDIQAYQTNNYLGHELLRQYNTGITTGTPASEENGSAPVAYWKFDEGTGTTNAAKNSGSGGTALAGTLTNMATPPTAGTSGWQTEDQCISGKCLAFDGTDDYVTVPDNSLLRATTNTLTVSSWVKADTISGIQTVLGKGRRADGTGYNLLVNEGVPTFGFCGNGCGGTTSSMTLSVKTWYLLTGTYDGTTFKIYVNGVLKGSSTLPGKVASATEPLLIGNEATGLSRYFKGTIDEPKVYPYARTAAQVKADYLKGAAQAGSSSVQGFQSPSNLTNGLVGYWKMDEASYNNVSGEAKDASGNGNHGTGVGYSSTSLPAGKFGNGGTFNGTSQYINTGSNITLANTSFTLSSWAKLAAVDGQWHVIMQKGTSGSTDNSLYFGFRNGSSNGFTCDFFSDGITLSASYTDTNWHLWNCVYDSVGKTKKIYRDGVLVGSAASNNYTGSGTLVIGRSQMDAGLYFSGQLDETRVYNRALTPAEIQQLYNSAPGPVGWWKMDEKTGTTANDSSGFGNTGTWQGTLGNQWTSGKYGSAGQFNGTNNNVTLNSVNGIPANDAPQTLSAWFKNPNPSSSGDQNMVVIKTGSSAANQLRITSGSLQVSRWGSGVTISTTAPPANEWHYATYTWDGTNSKLYLDGILKASNTTAPQSGVTDHVYIGYYNAPGYYTGQIDDVKIYNYARTPAQILEDMAGDGSPTPINSSVAGDATKTSPAAPVGYWKFDEANGTTANNSGNGGSALNGTLTNMSAPATATSGWTQSGKVNKALSFDGNNDYVTTADTPALNPTTAMSMSLWLKRTGGVGSRQVFIGKGDGNSAATYQYSIELQANNTLFFKLVNSGLAVSNLITTDKTITDTTTWHHIVTTWDGTIMKVYLDGSPSTQTASFSGPMNTTAINFSIGRLGTLNTYYFNGLIDEPKLYNYALTPDQVLNDYNQGLAVNYGVGASSEASTLSDGAGAPPVAYWSFDEKTGATANDTSGSNNTGTLTNGPTWTKGKVGSALSFDGTNDYVSVPSGNTSVNITGNLTISYWLKTTTVSNRSTISLGDSGGAGGYLACVGGCGSMPVGKTAFYSSGGGGWKSSNSTVNDGNWHQVQIVLSGSTVTFYKDGVADGSAASAAPLTWSGSRAIGSQNNGGGGFFPGSIDDVKIYNYARTPAQVAYDYNRGAPIGWWKMDECQGTAINDSSGNGNIGTLTVGGSGTVTAAGTCNTSGTAWGNGATGKSNSSMSFDGVDDYVTVTDSNNLYNLTGDLTLSAWVKTTASGGILISKGTTQNWLYNLAIGGGLPSFKIYANNTGTGYLDAVGTTAINNGQWHLITGTISGTTSTLYVDGKFAATDTSTNGTRDSSSTGSLYFNNFFNSGNGQFVSGQLDDVRIYNYALSPTQVKALYNGGTSVLYAPAAGSP